MSEPKSVGLETGAEWCLEIRAFNAANDKSLPDSIRELIAELWQQYCLAATRPSGENHD